LKINHLATLPSTRSQNAIRIDVFQRSSVLSSGYIKVLVKQRVKNNNIGIDLACRQIFLLNFFVKLKKAKIFVLQVTVRKLGQRQEREKELARVCVGGGGLRGLAVQNSTPTI
jgi:hypothetical protein